MRCVTSQKNEDLNKTSEEAWNLALSICVLFRVLHNFIWSSLNTVVVRLSGLYGGGGGPDYPGIGTTEGKLWCDIQKNSIQ